MKTAWRNAGLTLLFCSIFLFASTFYKIRDTAVVSFTTVSGRSGTVTVDLPRQVFIGDAVRLNAKVKVNSYSSEPMNLELAARLEAGFEKLAPAGRVTLHMRSGSEVELIWKLRTGAAAAYPATLWIWVTSDTADELLLAREFTLQSCGFMGLAVRPVRIFAGFLAAGGLLLVEYGRTLRCRLKQV
jgi:hypothetical protein